MSETYAQPRPVVSVVLAMRNEIKYVREAIASLLDQDAADFDIEVLVIDGNSEDGSSEIVAGIAARDDRVRLLRNEKVRAPFAFNIGLREAKGKYVVILGSHTIYRKNYVSVCLREMLATGAIGCSGRVITRPANNTIQARLVCQALSHTFGSSGKSFRTQPEGFAETIPYPLMLKSALIEVGGYDEGMFRNQDNDMNRKLRVRGHKLYYTWKTSCIYHTPSSIRELVRYAFNNGFWNVISLKENFSSMGIRHFVPFAFLISVLCSLALYLVHYLMSGPRSLLFAAPLPLVLGSHFFLGIVVAVQTAVREKEVSALLLPFIFLALHLSYGWGTLWAFLSNAKKPVAASIHFSPVVDDSISDR